MMLTSLMGFLEWFFISIVILISDKAPLSPGRCRVHTLNIPGHCKAAGRGEGPAGIEGRYRQGRQKWADHP